MRSFALVMCTYKNVYEHNIGSMIIMEREKEREREIEKEKWKRRVNSVKSELFTIAYKSIP